MAFPIIGVDFLSNFKLLVDLTNMKLLAPSDQKIQLAVPHAGSIPAAAIGEVGATSTPSLPTVEAPPSSPSQVVVPRGGACEWEFP